MTQYITTTDRYTGETETSESHHEFLAMVRECFGEDAADALRLAEGGESLRDSECVVLRPAHDQASLPDEAQS